MIYETPEDWLARPPQARRALRHVGPRQDPDRGDAARARPTGSTTRSISASAPATWASTSSTTSSARRCATRSCAQLLRSDSIYIASNITFHNLDAALDLPRQARRPGQGRHPLRRVPPPPAPAPRRRDRRHPRRPALHRQGRGDLRLRPLRLRHLGLALRGGRPARPRRPGAAPISPARPCRSGSAAPRPTSRRSPRRFDRAPKPMYYPEDFLTELWTDYLRRARRRRRRGRSRRLHPPRLPRADGAPPAPLRRDGRPLGRHRRGRRGRRGARPAGLRRPGRRGAAAPSADDRPARATAHTARPRPRPRRPRPRTTCADAASARGDRHRRAADRRLPGRRGGRRPRSPARSRSSPTPATC